MCNCRIVAENNFLLESLAACHNVESKLMNRSFVNYLDNLTESLKFRILLNWTTHKQTLPIFLQSFDFHSDLLKAPQTLKDFVHQFWHKKEMFGLYKRHNNGLDLANKNSFLNKLHYKYYKYCYNFISGYNNSYVYIMQTYKVKIVSNQSCFTANITGWCGS